MISALRWGWVVSNTSRPLYPRERTGTHCLEGWVGPRADLDGCGKPRLYLYSIPEYVASRYIGCAITAHDEMELIKNLFCFKTSWQYLSFLNEGLNTMLDINMHVLQQHTQCFMIEFIHKTLCILFWGFADRASLFNGLSFWPTWHTNFLVYYYS
jgi:hypothetical protein